MAEEKHIVKAESNKIIYAADYNKIQSSLIYLIENHNHVSEKNIPGVGSFSSVALPWINFAVFENTSLPPNWKDSNALEIQGVSEDFKLAVPFSVDPDDIIAEAFPLNIRVERVPYHCFCAVKKEKKVVGGVVTISVECHKKNSWFDRLLVMLKVFKRS